MLLRQAGYSVRSVLGNSAAMQKAKATKFDLFIVGHAASASEQLEMIRWLKQRHPRSPVLALRRSPFSGERVNDADCVANVDDPKEWLQEVQDCLQRQ
jgi:CheY-like chemotaxis protein